MLPYLNKTCRSNLTWKITTCWGHDRHSLLTIDCFNLSLACFVNLWSILIETLLFFIFYNVLFCFYQARLKRHRWHKKVLKTSDPIIVSIGWRRYQTIPVFAIEDCNGRHRMLKYTPEHMHCLAMFWGPLAPPNTGVVAFQNLSNNQVWPVSFLFLSVFIW